MHRQRQDVRHQVVMVHQNQVVHLDLRDVVLVDFDKELVHRHVPVLFLAHLVDQFFDQDVVVWLQNLVLLNQVEDRLMVRVVERQVLLVFQLIQKFQMDYFQVALQVLVGVEFHQKFQMDYCQVELLEVLELKVCQELVLEFLK
jgi:hypothetical protein